MPALARLVISHKRLVMLAWLVLALAGGYASSHATKKLSYDFGLPGQPGYQANQQIAADFGTGGDNAPVLLVVTDSSGRIPQTSAPGIVAAVLQAAPGSRVVSYADTAALLSKDGRTGVVAVYPRPVNGLDAYAKSLPALRSAAVSASRPGGVTVTLTGENALATGGAGGSNVLVESLLGGVGALVVLVLVFGSVLALMPLLIAAASILTTFLMLWGITGITEVSFIVQYLLSLIGLGVAIDYALLIVTRWREEKGRGATNEQAVQTALCTAGRSVLFSGVTVAVSLAALIALPVPFLRSVGLTGLLIPLVSVAAAVTLLPALLLSAGPRLAWPNRRTPDPESRLWRGVGGWVVDHKWIAAIGSFAVLLALASPLLGLRLGEPTNASLASRGGPAATAITRLQTAGFGAGITQPVEVLTTRPADVVAALQALDGVSAVIAPAAWTSHGQSVVDAWTSADAASQSGSKAAGDIRRVAQTVGGRVGGIPAQQADFVTAVYGNAWWIGLIIVAVTFLLLARALRSIVLPVKALALNTVSVAAAYGITDLIWQHGFGTHALFGQDKSGAITVWVPVLQLRILYWLVGGSFAEMSGGSFASSVVVADLCAGAVGLAPEDPAGLVQEVMQRS